MPGRLTERQRAVLEFLERFIDDNGYAPSRSEIAAAFGWQSDNAAHDYLTRLAKKGYIEIKHGLRRAIRILRPATKPKHDWRSTLVSCLADLVIDLADSEGVEHFSIDFIVETVTWHFRAWIDEREFKQLCVDIGKEIHQRAIDE